MNITIIVRRFPVRSQTFVAQHAIELASKGYTVTVLSITIGPGISDDELKRFNETKVSIKYIEEVKPSALFAKTFWKMKRLIRSFGYTLMNPKIIFSLSSSYPWKMREMVTACLFKKEVLKLRPDIVHIHFGNTATPIIRLGLPIPTVITWHGVDANVIPKQKGPDVYRALFKKSCIHTVGSSFMYERLIELGANKDQLKIIPMGVDMNEFSYIARNQHKGSALQILSVGRLEDVKGHSYLIRAVSSLINSGALINLRIIGEGKLERELSKLIDNSGCSKSIELLGGKTSSSIRKELQSSHLFCLTGIEGSSGIETQGLVLIEAQATGLPVVSSNLGGIPDSVIHNQTGILCEQKNVSAIKEAIQFFIDEPQERIKCGLAGREFVTSKFSITGMIKSFENVYYNHTKW